MILRIFLCAIVQFGIIGYVFGVVPQITKLNVQCDRAGMKVNVEFDSPFNGIIFSKGHYSDPNCRHVKAPSGGQVHEFTISSSSCGSTASDMVRTDSPRGFKNVIIIQNDPEYQEVWDSARKLSCDWVNRLEKMVTFAPFGVDMLGVKEMRFAGDTVDCWMEIQRGVGPFAPQIGGVVPIGEKLTVVIYVRDKDSTFDVHVKDCYAYDMADYKNPDARAIKLTDEKGCPVKEKLVQGFYRTRDVRQSGATIIAYGLINAFKFPERMDVYLACNVEVCKETCPDNTCQPEVANAGELPETTTSGSATMSGSSGGDKDEDEDEDEEKQNGMKDGEDEEGSTSAPSKGDEDEDKEEEEEDGEKKDDKKDEDAGSGSSTEEGESSEDTTEDSKKTDKKDEEVDGNEDEEEDKEEKNENGSDSKKMDETTDVEEDEEEDKSDSSSSSSTTSSSSSESTTSASKDDEDEDEEEEEKKSDSKNGSGAAVSANGGGSTNTKGGADDVQSKESLDEDEEDLRGRAARLIKTKKLKKPSAHRRKSSVIAPKKRNAKKSSNVRRSNSKAGSLRKKTKVAKKKVSKKGAIRSRTSAKHGKSRSKSAKRIVRAPSSIPAVFARQMTSSNGRHLRTRRSVNVTTETMNATFAAMMHSMQIISPIEDFDDKELQAWDKLMELEGKSEEDSLTMNELIHPENQGQVAPIVLKTATAQAFCFTQTTLATAGVVMTATVILLSMALFTITSYVCNRKSTAVSDKIAYLS